MADEERISTEQPVPEAAPPEKKRSGLMVMLLFAVGSVLAGGATGVFMLGPKLASASTSASSESDGGHGAPSKGGHGGGASESPTYAIENIVVNPAGSQGTRFLVMSIAVELKDPGVAPQLRERDPQVRDVLLNLLASRTVDELADIKQRDSLRVAIAAAIEGIAGKGTVARVFLPQFVLQ